ncbi:chemokine-like factor isoform X1 [Silurus meridionalis]|nr:chemokine-like factor isoform X1 [Silurus meridionalis]
MAENQSFIEVDKAFLKSKRGLLKIAELVVLFVAFVCFTVASRPPYISATCLEFIITLALLILYFLKLHKSLTFFFWPLIDVFNSFFAALFLCIISLVAVSTFTTKGTLVGGDFLRCITASIVFFIISIMAVAKYPDGASKAAGVFGFVATIVFALDFYFIFNELADFLKRGGSNEEPQSKEDADADSDSE